MALSFDYIAKLIGVPQLEAQPLLIQTLVNSIRDEEASERGITYDQILDATGKAELGGGVFTGITAALRSTWKLSFATGSYQASLDGGNLADGLSRIDNTGSPQVLLLSSAASTISIATLDGSVPTANEIATAVLSAATSTPIHSDIRKVNDIIVDGAGTEVNPWGPV